MAVRIINIVQGNTAPAQIFTLERDGEAIDVTDCTINLILARGTTVTNTGHQECSIVTPASGIVSYQPEDGDFDSPGFYVADIQIIYPGGSQEILYDQVEFDVRRKIDND